MGNFSSVSSLEKSRVCVYIYISADPSRMLGERAGEECSGDRGRQAGRQADRQTDRRETERQHFVWSWFWPRGAAFFLIFLSGQKATLGTGKG